MRCTPGTHISALEQTCVWGMCVGGITRETYNMRGFRIRTCSQGGVGPLAEPRGSSALDAGREPRRRQFECAAAKSKAGVLWLVQAAGR